MKNLAVINAIILFPLTILCQVPEITWQQCYGSSEFDHADCIVETESGYLIGITLDEYEPGITNWHGQVDIWLIETDTTGNMIWEKCYGGSQGEGPKKLIKTTDNGYYIVGSTNSIDGDVQSYNHGGGDYWIVRLDTEKNIIWEKCFGTPVGEGPRDALLTNDGGLIVMGRIKASGGDVSVYYGDNDIWMFRIDSAGNLLWEKTIGNEGLDNGISITYNSEGNIMLIGAAAHHGGMVECYPDENWGDVWLVELDLQGNILSQHCYGGSDYDFGVDIEELEYGYLFIAKSYSNDGDVSGHHGPSGGNDAKSDFWIVEINKFGQILWEYSYGGWNSETPRHISKTADGGIVAIGTTFSNDGDVSGNHSAPGTDTDIWAVKLDSVGEIEWQKCYGGWRSERLENPHTILKKDDYNYVIAASTDYVSDDVQCNIHAPMDRDAWLFEIKDCSIYMPATPQPPAGPDTLCLPADSITHYSIEPATGAWYYEWKLEPDSAGTITGDSLQCTIQWSPAFEGTASIMARSINDCGESEWSQPKYTQVYSCLGTAEHHTGSLRVYPNPAGDYVIFEIPATLANNGVIPIRRLAERNLPQRSTAYNKAPAFKESGNSLGVSHYSAQGQTQGFDMTGGAEKTEVIILNLFGQVVAQLPLTGQQTVWDTGKVKNGLYFYKTEIEGKQYSGKVVVQK